MFSKFPRFIGFFTRKTILILVAFLVFAGGGLPYLNHQQSVSQPLQISKQIWTSTRDLTAEQNAAAHFKKHGKDFGFETEAQYVEAVHKFISNPPIGTLTLKQKDGDTIFYNPELNWFAVKNKNNTPRTLFKPDPKIHGYETNMDYFNAQASRTR